MDSDDNIWVANFGGHRVTQLNGASGQPIAPNGYPSDALVRKHRGFYRSVRQCVVAQQLADRSDPDESRRRRTGCVHRTRGPSQDAIDRTATATLSLFNVAEKSGYFGYSIGQGNPSLAHLRCFAAKFASGAANRIYNNWNFRDGATAPFRNAGIAQLVEQLICNQQVVGSNPTAGSLVTKRSLSGLSG